MRSSALPDAGDGGGDGTTVFVKGFDRSLGEETLRTQLTEVFSAYGEVQSIRLPTDRETGDVKGFGYIEFGSTEGKVGAASDYFPCVSVL